MQKIYRLGLLVATLSAVLPSFAGSALVDKRYLVTGFNTVVADGYYNLTVHPGNASQAAVKTSSYSESPIMISVHDRTLYIVSRYAAHSPRPYFPGRAHPSVDLQLAGWKGLSVYGPVNVKASGIATDGFTLNAMGYGTIRIDDLGRLQRVDQRGTNVVTLSGIKSDVLTVYATGFSKLTLQGFVNTLHARLNHNAILYARQLVANNVMIQARYNAQGYVYPQKTLRAFTDQSADIYYYKHLTNLTRHPVQSGNVFQIKL